jgi:hypothetical protein
MGILDRLLGKPSVATLAEQMIHAFRDAGDNTDLRFDAFDLARADLRDFINTGVFGPVHLGCSREQLEAAIGRPEATGGVSRKHRRPTIWKYGDVEFFFARPSGELEMIHIDHFSGTYATPEGWGDLQLDPLIIREGMRQETLIDAAAQRGCSYVVVPEPRWDTSEIVFQSGVMVGFVMAPDRFSDFVGLGWLTRCLQGGVFSSIRARHA